jgi:hypothetical protein
VAATGVPMTSKAAIHRAIAVIAGRAIGMRIGLPRLMMLKIRDAPWKTRRIIGVVTSL